MPEKPRRKVNPPSRLKKKVAEQRRARATGGKEPMKGAGGTFFATILAVLIVGALIYFGYQYYAKANPVDTQPWLSTEERIVAADETQETGVYRYKAKEVALWKAGAANPELPADDLNFLLDRAVTLLSLPDATDVILVAAAGRPDQLALIAPHAANLAGKANQADPVERECRMKLLAIKAP